MRECGIHVVMRALYGKERKFIRILVPPLLFIIRPEHNQISYDPCGWVYFYHSNESRVI
jgi:hypothetical protein